MSFWQDRYEVYEFRLCLFETSSIEANCMFNFIDFVFECNLSMCIPIRQLVHKDIEKYVVICFKACHS